MSVAIGVAVGLGLSARIAWLRSHDKVVPGYMTSARTMAAAVAGVALFFAFSKTA